MIYLASYKHKKKITSLQTFFYAALDKLTRILTRGKYSHCELVYRREDGRFECFSSSPRDGGVRRKVMNLSPLKWDLHETNCTKERLDDYFEQTKHMAYDFTGAVGLVIFTPDDKQKAFCSEWCFNCISQSTQGWRFSPNHLAAVKY